MQRKIFLVDPTGLIFEATTDTDKAAGDAAEILILTAEYCGGEVKATEGTDTRPISEWPWFQALMAKTAAEREED